MVTARGIRKRGFAGRFFLFIFYGFNLLMVWWLLDYWGKVGDSLHTGSHAAQTGAAIGTTIGTGLVLFIWALGSIITGLLAILTRGRRTYVEDELDDLRAFGPEQTAPPQSFESTADPKRQGVRPTQFGRGRPRVMASSMASSSAAWSPSGALFWAVLVICGLIFLGAVGQILNPEGASALREAREAKQQETAAEPQKQQMKDTTSRKEVASSFSNLLTVDSIRLSIGTKDTVAIVTVRVPTKLRGVKCAVNEGSRYLGVGYGPDASPPAADVYVTIPGNDYTSGSVRAECSSE
jgi:hypothetical protein